MSGVPSETSITDKLAYLIKSTDQDIDGESTNSTNFDVVVEAHR